MDKRFDRVDMILANLKQVEPSPAFEAEFKRRLGAAIARRYEEKLPDRILRTLQQGAYNLRNALLPDTRVLVRVMATFVIVISVGYYVYMQPSCPMLLGQTGPARSFHVGDTISADEGSPVDIGVANKYVIRIKGGSSLRIAKLTPQYGKGSAIFSLNKGQVLVNVEEGFKGSKFIVETKSARATALGTKFSVDESAGDESSTEVSVLQGRVEVYNSHMPYKMLLAKETVIVGAGQKTRVLPDGIPSKPTRLIEEEWLKLEELYQIGRKPQIVLLVKNTPDRVKQLLKPCPIYITDEKPREIPPLMEKAILKIAEAVKEKDLSKHLESIKMLERIVNDHPNRKYDMQLLLYIGAYYEYLGNHEDAIKTFKEAIARYPDSAFASMAQCAIGVIYEEKMGDMRSADEAYGSVIAKYPNSLEAIWVERKLGLNKTG